MHRNGTYAALQSVQLMRLFENGLKDLLWSEKAIVRVIPKMIRNSTSIELIDTLVEHLDETHKQVERLNLIFSGIDRRPLAKKSESMEALIREMEDTMATSDPGAMCDAGILSAVRKIEHYEIAVYGSLCQFAELLGLDDARALLETSLNEENTAAVGLAEIAACLSIEEVHEDFEHQHSSNTFTQ
jgi:ferritin-like metal-binding protein YciE